MPRYKYSCNECKLTDVRKFAYEYEHQTERHLRVCPYCGGPLNRKFLKPPKEWLIRQIQQNLN